MGSTVIDLHTHHRRCGHATGELGDYVAAAAGLGLATLGLSDHAPLLLDGCDEPAPGMHMPLSAFDGYLAEARAWQSRAPHGLEVLVGVEADYIPGREEAYRRLLDDPRIDFTIGAVHYIDGFHVYDPARWKATDDVDAVMERYLALVRDAARTRMFDVIAHLDAVKGRAPRHPYVPDATWDATIDALLAADVAVEINTSGYRKCGEPFPAWNVIERLHAAGVPLTYGSDAHRPDEVAHAWTAVRRGLTDRGVRELAIVRRRRRSLVPIDDRWAEGALPGTGSAP